MTIRQQILKRLYPLLTGVQGILPRKGIRTNGQGTLPPIAIYSLSVTLNNGTVLPLSQLRGQKILLVNTASDCGYTAQYAELQSLYVEAKGKLAIIAFPANDFKEQERGNDEAIATFCAVNYGVRFPIARKAPVLQGPTQQPVFRWLTTATENGWNNEQPVWNFTKYLVNEAGILTHVFAPAVSPLGRDLQAALQE